MEFNKTCELCGDEYTYRHQTHTGGRKDFRLCYNCQSIKKDIDAVLDGKSYSLATDEDKQRIVQRVSQNRTVNRGYRFNYKEAERGK